MAYNYSDSTERMTSEFNEAQFQIMRLHQIWLECKSLSESGRLMAWRWRLHTAMMELWADAKRLDRDEEKEEGYIYKLKKIDKEIHEAIKNKKVNAFFYKLTEKQMLLKELQEDSGKGAKFKFANDDGI